MKHPVLSAAALVVAIGAGFCLGSSVTNSSGPTQFVAPHLVNSAIAAPAANSPEANKAIIRKFYDQVMNHQNVDAIDQFVATDFVDHNPDPDQGPGAEGVKNDFKAMNQTFPDGHATLLEILAEKDLVADVVAVTGTMKGKMMGMDPTNKSFNVTLTDVFRMKNGKIIERWGPFDAVTAMSQLGLMPSHSPQ